jgi:molecular chaperone GrpE (heat shock protein)
VPEPEPESDVVAEHLARLEQQIATLVGDVQQVRAMQETAQAAPEPEPEPAPEPAPDVVAEHLARLEQQIATLVSDVQQFRAAHEASVNRAAADDTTLQERLAGLEKQISRVGREQFKANALTEAQNEQIERMLTDLRAAEEQRVTEIDRLRHQIKTAQDDARLDVVQAVLPALDSLDEAIRSGGTVLAQHAMPQRRGLGAMLANLTGQTAHEQEVIGALREALDAWIIGLGYVQQRLLTVLDAEGVRPIEATGQPFDPRRHVVLDVVPAGEELPPNTVATEFRRGYLVYDRVLRLAEVAVTRAEETRSETSEETRSETSEED